MCALLYDGGVAQSGAQDQRLGSISGHVYRADTGEPIAKAMVTLMPDREDTNEVQYMKTDGGGAYKFIHVEPGKYNVQAEHIGFLASKHNDPDPAGNDQTIILKSGQDLDKIDVQLEPVGAISGTIVDEDNEPVRGLFVVALRPFFFWGGRAPVFSYESGLTFTDDLGHFRLSGLQAGSYYIRVGGDNGRQTFQGPPIHAAKYGITYYPRATTLGDTQRIRVTPGMEISDINIVVTTQFHTYTVRGAVTNLSGNADRRFSVIIHRTGTGPQNAIGLIATTNANADGSFVLPGVPPGEYVVTAEQSQLASRGAGQSSSAIAATGEATVRVEDSDMKVGIVIQPPSEVRGIVASETGTRAGANRNLWVRLDKELDAKQIEESLPDEPVSKVEEHGEFNLQNIRPGTYRFSVVGDGMNRNYVKVAQCSGTDYATRPINVEPGIVVSDCTLTIASDSCVISGQVLDGDAPVKGFEVVAIPELMSLRYFGAYTKKAPMKTDGNGRFQIAGVIPGDYVLYAVPEDPLRGYFALDFADRNASSGERVTVKSGESKTINLKPTSTPQ